MVFCFKDFFKAVGHPVRQEILNLLHDKGELSVNELVKKLKLSQSTVSHHLAILKKAKVVQTREEGTQVFYTVCCSTISGCCGRMKKYFGS